jgi:hypothetical protein
MSESKEVVNWKEQLAAEAKAVASREQPAVSQISLRGGQMTFMGEPIPGNILETVVLAASFERNYYNRPFDPEDKSPPDCYAKALAEPDLVPMGSKPEAESCAACPLSEFGSAPVGGGQACKMRRKLVLTPPDGGEQLAFISTPPTSNRNWMAYSNKVATGLSLPFWAVVTRIKCVPHKTWYMLEFEVVKPVEEDVLPGLHGMIARAEELLLQPIDESEEEAPAPKKPKKY